MIELFKEESLFFVGDLLRILEKIGMFILDIFMLYLILDFDLFEIVIFFIRIVDKFDFGNKMFVGLIFRNFFICLVWISNWIGFLFGWDCIVKVFILNFWL